MVFPNVTRHKRVCDELNKLYEKKNHDYGDSFHDGWMDWGIQMAVIRLWDKLNRVKTLVKGGAVRKVSDESLRDSLIDLANYAIMTVMELDRDDEENVIGPMWKDDGSRKPPCDAPDGYMWAINFLDGSWTLEPEKEWQKEMREE